MARPRSPVIAFGGILVAEAASADQPAALLLHGFFSLPVMMAALARDFRVDGYHVESPFYPSWRWPMARIADHLSMQVARSDVLAKAPRIDIVAHSMGGLLARAIIARHRPANLGRVVCLGTPHGGSEIADRLHASALFRRTVLGAAGPALVTKRGPDWDSALGPVDYPLGNIAGTSSSWEGPTARLLPVPHDGKVSLASTHCNGEADHIALPVPHRLLPFDRSVRLQAMAFVSTGAFLRVRA